MITKDYSLFKFFPGNRPINETHVDSIVKSIKEIGYMKHSKIVCTEEMAIIDGQHRYAACMKLGLPINYEIEDLPVDKAMVLLNKNQKSWKLSDYVNLHAGNGIKCYQTLIEFEEKYGLGYSNSIRVCFIKASTGNTIREGKEFELNEKRLEIVEFLREAGQFVSYWRNSKFVLAVLTAYTKLEDEDIEKLRISIGTIPQQPNTEAFLSIFENIINRSRKTNRIHLV